LAPDDRTDRRPDPGPEHIRLAVAGITRLSRISSRIRNWGGVIDWWMIASRWGLDVYRTIHVDRPLYDDLPLDVDGAFDYDLANGISMFHHPRVTAFVALPAPMVCQCRQRRDEQCAG
jgi:hypothetical protein